MLIVATSGLILVSVIIVILCAAILLMREFNKEVGRATKVQADVTRFIVRDISGVIRDSVTTTTKSVVDNTMGAIVGKPGTPVTQPTPDPANDPFSPVWTEWEEKATLDDPRLFGVGDIEMMDRDHEGATYLAPGESIIPGIPLPDMSAERYQDPRPQ